MSHLPTLIVYNKMDKAPSTFVPDRPEHLLISALDQDAPKEIKQRMIELIEKNWTFFTEDLSEEKGKELAQLKQQAWITKLEYMEEKACYRIEGYRPRKETTND